MSTWTTEPFFEFWQRMLADAPANELADQIAPLQTAVDAEQETIRELEKRMRRRQRWIDRHTGKGYLWA
jgi:hypothetical protein